MTTDFIPPANPIIGHEEREAVDRVLRSGMVAQGPEVAAFEEEFSQHFVQGRPTVAVNSGTHHCAGPFIPSTRYQQVAVQEEPVRNLRYVVREAIRRSGCASSGLWPQYRMHEPAPAAEPGLFVRHHPSPTDEATAAIPNESPARLFARFFRFGLLGWDGRSQIALSGPHWSSRLNSRRTMLTIMVAAGGLASRSPVRGSAAPAG